MIEYLTLHQGVKAQTNDFADHLCDSPLAAEAAVAAAPAAAAAAAAAAKFPMCPKYLKLGTFIKNMQQPSKFDHERALDDTEKPAYGRSTSSR